MRCLGEKMRAMLARVWRFDMTEQKGTPVDNWDYSRRLRDIDNDFGRMWTMVELLCTEGVIEAATAQSFYDSLERSRSAGMFFADHVEVKEE